MRLWLAYSVHPEGESMKVGFDGGIKLEFYDYLEEIGYLQAIRLSANDILVDKI